MASATKIRESTARPPPGISCIVAPASNVKRDMLEAGCDGLRQAGYEPFYFESILDRDLYFAGRWSAAPGTRRHVRARRYLRHRLRARRLRLELPAPALDPNKIVSHPKFWWLQRHHDAGLLHCRLGELRTFHGPMVARILPFRRRRFDSWQNALGGACVEDGASPRLGREAAGRRRSRGILYGGCLSMLAASLGTLHEIRTAGTILFIEDIAAKPFQIGRMLMQLKLAGKLNDVRGLVFGEMLDCARVRIRITRWKR